LKIGVFAPTGKKGSPLPTILLVTKLVNDLACGIRMLAQLSFVLSQSTRLTVGRTDFLVAIVGAGILCRAVKM